MPTNYQNKTGNGSVRSSAETAAYGGVNGSTASRALGGVKQRVTSRVDERKNRAADGLGGNADVIRGAGDELRRENETLASYVDMASDQMKRVADQIRRKGVADLLDDVHGFARRRPALFIAGAFLIGLGVARFLKSSADRSAMRDHVDAVSSADLSDAGGY